MGEARLVTVFVAVFRFFTFPVIHVVADFQDLSGICIHLDIHDLVVRLYDLNSINREIVLVFQFGA